MFQRHHSVFQKALAISRHWVQVCRHSFSLRRVEISCQRCGGPIVGRGCIICHTRRLHQVWQRPIIIIINFLSA
jgi:hypothetical protein